MRTNLSETPFDFGFRDIKKDLYTWLLRLKKNLPQETGANTKYYLEKGLHSLMGTIFSETSLFALGLGISKRI